jgi:SAM-dependent methyltransferase
MSGEGLQVVTRTSQRIKRVWKRAQSRIQGMQARALYRKTGLPIPPPRLVHLVAGTDDVHWFVASGALAVRGMRNVLERHGLAVESFSAILDFGCGVGRTLRHWNELKGPLIHGTDYNPTLIDWCQRNLPFAQFQVNGIADRLSYADSTFDFIYAFSVMTHLDELKQVFWMSELARVLKPAGHLLISVHGETYVPELAPDERQRFRAGQLVVRGAPGEGSNRCASFHPVSFVRDVLAASYRVVDFVPEGALGNPRQDVYLLQKVALAEMQNARCKMQDG